MRARLLSSFVLMFALALPALAQDRRGGSSLDRVLPHVRQTVPGTFYDAEGPYFGANGHPTYRLKWMTPDGRMIWFGVDAQSGQVLGGMPSGPPLGRYRDDGDRGGWGNRTRDNWSNGDGGGWGPGGGQGGNWGGRDGGYGNGQGDRDGQGGWRGRSGNGGGDQGDRDGQGGWRGRGGNGGGDQGDRGGQGGWRGRGGHGGQGSGGGRGGNERGGGSGRHRSGGG